MKELVEQKLKSTPTLLTSEQGNIRGEDEDDDNSCL